VPSLAEEEVAEEVNSIKKTIEDFGGIFLTEGYPKMQALEYTIEVPITMPKTRFNHSLFGWIKFEAEGEASLSIKEKLSLNKNIIRMILVKTVKENTLYGYKLKQKKEAEERREEEMKKISEETEVSDEEIDKSIEEIIV
jgi:ribosomal protein S6